MVRGFFLETLCFARLIPRNCHISPIPSHECVDGARTWGDDVILRTGVEGRLPYAPPEPFLRSSAAATLPGRTIIETAAAPPKSMETCSYSGPKALKL